VCGFYAKFEKDDAPYAAIRFMANYHCYNCLNLCSISDGFMINVSPDEGIKDLSGAVSEEEHISKLSALKAFSEVEKKYHEYGNA
jgi:hypothetical protein